MNKMDFEIKDGLNNMDFNRVTEMLSKSYWCSNIKIEEVKKGASNSALNVGVFLKNGNQIGYARVVSDKTRFAYIMDVFVDESYRKNGIGQEIIKYILNHNDLKDVYQWLLITKDAHEVYKKVGFNITKLLNNWMEIRNERPNR